MHTTEVVMTRELALSDTDPSGYPEACGRLRFVRTLLEAAEADNQAVRSRHAHDIAIISERLITEADDRGWCDVYDDVVSALNNDLYLKLEERSRDYTVEVQAMVTFKIKVENQYSKTDAEELATSWIENSADEYIDDVYEIDVRSAEVE